MGWNPGQRGHLTAVTTISTSIDDNSVLACRAYHTSHRILCIRKALVHSSDSAAVMGTFEGDEWGFAGQSQTPSGHGR